MLLFKILVFLTSPAWGTQVSSPQEDGDFIMTRETVQEVTSSIKEDLQTVQASIVQAYVNPFTYLTPSLTYQTLAPDYMAKLLETCYTQQGYLLHNPSLLDTLWASLPQEFFVANFDTEQLFSKTNEQVLHSIQQASQGHTCSVVSKTESSYQIALGDCSQSLSGICISPITEFENTQYSTNLVRHFKLDLPPILNLTIQSLTYFSSQLIVARPWINTIGIKLRELGTLSSQLKSDTANNVPSMSLFFKIERINQCVRQILHLNLISQAQVLTKTQEQSIQQDINSFKLKLQALDASTQRQQEHLLDQHRTNQEAAQELLKQQSQQAHSLLQQLEKATKQLNSTQTTLLDSTTTASILKDDSTAEDESSGSGTALENQFVDLGLNTFTGFLYDEIRAIQVSMDACKANGTTCCLLNQTKPTVSLWPTQMVLTYKEVMEYSIYNFYAAVSWSIIMFTILVISCCYTNKQSQQIHQLQLEIKVLKKCQCPIAAAAGPSSGLREPLLNKRKIINALHYAASDQ